MKVNTVSNIGGYWINYSLNKLQNIGSGKYTGTLPTREKMSTIARTN